ncbi:MAG: hypothetical protein ACXVLM_21815, partial [Ilumatobacteraceae bacterium]
MAARQGGGTGGRRGAQPRRPAATGRPAPKAKGRAAASATGRPAPTAKGPAPSAARGRGAPDRSSRQFASRGAGRTGRVVATGEERRKPEKTLGGEQVEGRQAVRELLIAGRRKVREVWVATDLLEGESASDIVTDIVEIARSV